MEEGIAPLPLLSLREFCARHSVPFDAAGAQPPQSTTAQIASAAAKGSPERVRAMVASVRKCGNVCFVELREQGQY